MDDLNLCRLAALQVVSVLITTRRSSLKTLDMVLGTLRSRIDQLKPSIQLTVFVEIAQVAQDTRNNCCAVYRICHQTIFCRSGV